MKLYTFEQLNDEAKKHAQHVLAEPCDWYDEGGEPWYDVSVIDLGDGPQLIDDYKDYSYVEAECEDGEYTLFDSRESAGEAAREYWAEMAEYDPSEFTCLVGEQTLVSWALGQSAGPGYIQVSSLDEWLDLWLASPEEHFASYDGCEVDAKIWGPICEELGVDEGAAVVAYRTR